MAKSEKLTVKELKEKLLADKKNAVLRMSEEELKKCDKFCEGYKAFLDIAKTEREASAEIVKMRRRADSLSSVRRISTSPATRFSTSTARSPLSWLLSARSPLRTA